VSTPFLESADLAQILRTGTRVDASTTVHEMIHPSELPAKKWLSAGARLD
jgi:hypothetical protein